MKRFLLCSVFLGLLSSCGGGDSTTDPPPPPVSLQLAIVDGDGQEATVATALPQDLVVKVTDSSANPQSGATVSWSITRGDAALGASSTSTNAEGLASTRLTLGTTAAPVTVRASASGTTPVTFSATALPGPAEVLRLEPSFGVLALSGSTSLTVNLTDAYGNAVGDAVAEFESRNPSIMTISGTTASGQALGVTRVIARAESFVDSATYAVVEPDGFALVLLTEDGRACAEVPLSSEIRLRLSVLRPVGAIGGIASLQGFFSWETGKLTLQGSTSANSRFIWALNESASGSGAVRFAGFRADRVVQLAGDLGLTFQVGDEPAEIVPIVEIAGDENATAIAHQILPVATRIAIGGD